MTVNCELESLQEIKKAQVRTDKLDGGRGA